MIKDAIYLKSLETVFLLDLWSWIEIWLFKKMINLLVLSSKGFLSP